MSIFDVVILLDLARFSNNNGKIHERNSSKGLEEEEEAEGTIQF